MTTTGNMLRPYAWLALAAFVLGFAGCLLAAWPASGDGMETPAVTAAIPASPGWDAPRLI